MGLGSVISLAFTVNSIYCSIAGAVPLSGPRVELAQTPPLSSYDYTVPLQGSLTCSILGVCAMSLPAPPSDKKLSYLTIARGISTYTCNGQNSDKRPVLQSQTATLWDALPILPHISSEDSFHTLIPQLLEFDYAALVNSSLSCIGSISMDKEEYFFDIFDATVFTAQLQDDVNAPENPSQNFQWADFYSSDLEWIVYRVETAGGVPPSKCEGQRAKIIVDYSAEYWFYH